MGNLVVPSLESHRGFFVTAGTLVEKEVYVIVVCMCSLRVL